MGHRRLYRTAYIYVFASAIAFLSTGCDMFSRDSAFPHVIELPNQGGAVCVDLDFTRFATSGLDTTTNGDFCIDSTDTVYRSSWLEVEVQPDGRTVFTAEPNTTGRKRSIMLNRLGPDNTDVDIIQK